MFGKTKIV